MYTQSPAQSIVTAHFEFSLSTRTSSNYLIGICTPQYLKASQQLVLCFHYQCGGGGIGRRGHALIGTHQRVQRYAHRGQLGRQNLA